MKLHHTEYLDALASQNIKNQSSEVANPVWAVYTVIITGLHDLITNTNHKKNDRLNGHFCTITAAAFVAAHNTGAAIVSIECCCD